MLNIGASELLFIVIVAIVVIGPKDLPLALRTAGRWIGKIRRVSRHFQMGLETMIREAELEEMEKKWREQNAQILAAHPPAPAELEADPALAGAVPPQAEVAPAPSEPPMPATETASQPPVPEDRSPDPASPELPLSTR